MASQLCAVYPRRKCGSVSSKVRTREVHVPVASVPTGNAAEDEYWDDILSRVLTTDANGSFVPSIRTGNKCRDRHSVVNGVLKFLDKREQRRAACSVSYSYDDSIFKEVKDADGSNETTESRADFGEAHIDRHRSYSEPTKCDQSTMTTFEESFLSSIRRPCISMDTVDRSLVEDRNSEIDRQSEIRNTTARNALVPQQPPRAVEIINVVPQFENVPSTPYILGTQRATTTNRPLLSELDVALQRAFGDEKPQPMFNRQESSRMPSPTNNYNCSSIKREIIDLSDDDECAAQVRNKDIDHSRMRSIPNGEYPPRIVPDASANISNPGIFGKNVEDVLRTLTADPDFDNSKSRHRPYVSSMLEKCTTNQYSVVRRIMDETRNSFKENPSLAQRTGSNYYRNTMNRDSTIDPLPADSFGNRSYFPAFIEPNEPKRKKLKNTVNYQDYDKLMNLRNAISNGLMSDRDVARVKERIGISDLKQPLDVLLDQMEKKRRNKNQRVVCGVDFDKHPAPITVDSSIDDTGPANRMLATGAWNNANDESIIMTVPRPERRLSPSSKRLRKTLVSVSDKGLPVPVKSPKRRRKPEC